MFERMRTYNSLSAVDKERFSEMYKVLKATNFRENFIFNDESLKQFNEAKNTNAIYDFFIVSPAYGLTPSEIIKDYESMNEVFHAVVQNVKEKCSPDMFNFLNPFFKNASELPWDDSPIVQVIAMNEFLGSNSSMTYGEFFETNKKEIDSLVKELHLSPFADTTNLVKATTPHFTSWSKSFSPILLLGDSKKSHREVIYSLTVDEMRKIISIIVSSSYHAEYKAGKSQLSVKANILVNSIRIDEKSHTKEDVRKHLLMAFSKSYTNSTPGEIPSNPIATLVGLTEAMKEISMVDQISAASSSYVLADRVYKISHFLVENSEYFSGIEMSAIIYSLGTRSAIVRGGSHDDYIRLIEDVINNYELEEAIDFFKIIADVVLRYNNTLPTVHEWRKSISDGVTFLGGDIAVEMAVSTAAYNKKRNVHIKLKDFRRGTV